GGLLGALSATPHDRMTTAPSSAWRSTGSCVSAVRNRSAAGTGLPEALALTHMSEPVPGDPADQGLRQRGVVGNLQVVPGGLVLFQLLAKMFQRLGRRREVE